MPSHGPYVCQHALDCTVRFLPAAEFYIFLFKGHKRNSSGRTGWDWRLLKKGTAAEQPQVSTAVESKGGGARTGGLSLSLKYPMEINRPWKEARFQGASAVFSLASFSVGRKSAALLNENTDPQPQS